MNLPIDNAFASNSNSGPGEAERTLRIIAGLPAPEGLEDRIMDALSRAPRTASVLPWPEGKRGGWMGGSLIRGAAAAAIVFVVGGGSWTVYSRAHPPQAPKVIAMPRVAAPRGFATGGAMRTPQTLNGPTLAHPVQAPQRQVSAPAAKKPQKRGKAAASKAPAK
jgi:hypothetical protein